MNNLSGSDSHKEIAPSLSTKNYTSIVIYTNNRYKDLSKNIKIIL